LPWCIWRDLGALTVVQRLHLNLMNTQKIKDC